MASRGGAELQKRQETGLRQERQHSGRQESSVARLPRGFSEDWGVEQDVLRGHSCSGAGPGENGEGQNRGPRPQTTGERSSFVSERSKETFTRNKSKKIIYKKYPKLIKFSDIFLISLRPEPDDRIDSRSNGFKEISKTADVSRTRTRTRTETDTSRSIHDPDKAALSRARAHTHRRDVTASLAPVRADQPGQQAELWPNNSSYFNRVSPWRRSDRPPLSSVTALMMM